ncbi:hypothetical protein A1F99_103870 [Pyrenophora tritici-repentis]|nr:hypothetical protein A1F99_103870 [Pyrenophora tritici-repentis]
MWVRWKSARLAASRTSTDLTGQDQHWVLTAEGTQVEKGHRGHGTGPTYANLCSLWSSLAQSVNGVVVLEWGEMVRAVLT